MPVWLLKYWRELALVLLCAASFAIGRWGNRTTTTSTDKTNQTQVVATVDKDNDSDAVNKVTTITKNKDGTTTETIVDHSKIVDTKVDTTQSTTHTTETKTTTTTSGPSGKAGDDRYYVSLGVTNGISLKWAPDYQAEVGYKLIGPLWGNVSYDISTHKPGVGVTLVFP